ncbi:outer membrane beta-barrel family protein [soil metagenome]
MKKNKNTISLIIFTFLIILFLTSSGLFAQNDPNAPKRPRGNRQKGDSTQITTGTDFQGSGTISGLVVDKETKLPLEGTVITLKSLKDSTKRNGAISDNLGRFTIEADYGVYKMNIDYIGYNGAVNNRVLLRKPALLLDTIRLSTGTNVTEEIRVEDQRSLIEFQPGKKVFNVGNSDLYQNGSAVDVLKDVPSVTVDIDNNVSLRGSSEVKILIDGRPSGLNTNSRTSILEQIPASSIQSIELVTNPDAKYDAEGTSGVINIVLKKNEDLGLNGAVSFGAGTLDKYNGSLNLNAKNNKMNLYGSYNYRLFNSPGTGSLDRLSLLDNSRLLQNSDLMMRMNNNSVKAGIDYYTDENSTLGFSLGYSNRDRKRGSTESTSQVDGAGNLTYNTQNKAEENESGKSWDLDLNYLKKFKNPKQQLNIDLGYSRNNEDNSQLSTYYDLLNPIANVPMQNDIGNNVNNDGQFSIDYIQPLGDAKSNSKFNIGYKGTMRNNDNVSTYQNYDYTTNSFVEDLSISNSFNYKEIINAVYGIYNSSFKDFSFSLGLRAEKTNSKGDLITNNTQFDQNYFSLFPSLSLSQKLGLGQEVQVTYSRRIRRPRGDDLNPFIERSDPLNLRQGNPALLPMFIDSYELSLINYIGQQTVLTPSLFFRQTHDEITRYRTLIDSNVTLTTFANNTSSKTYGAEVIFNSKLFDLVSLNGNINYYKSEVDASNIQPGLVNSTYSWSGRLMAGANFADILNVQLSYNYNGKRLTGQGEIDPVQSMDIAFRKDLFDKTASISLRVSDVLNQQKFNVTLNDVNYTENLIRSRNSRAAFLTFTYNFGRQEKSKNPKRKDDNKPNDITPPDDSPY